MGEEEWSYIPVGGPLPLGSQAVTAFGAAANLVHPATGYSITRSLREAPRLARCKEMPRLSRHFCLNGEQNPTKPVHACHLIQAWGSPQVELHSCFASACPKADAMPSNLNGV